MTASFSPLEETETGWFNFVFPPELLNPKPERIISADSFSPKVALPFELACVYVGVYSYTLREYQLSSNWPSLPEPEAC